MSFRDRDYSPTVSIREFIESAPEHFEKMHPELRTHILCHGGSRRRESSFDPFASVIAEIEAFHDRSDSKGFSSTQKGLVE